jgi:hypothetical protein
MKKLKTAGILLLSAILFYSCKVDDGDNTAPTVVDGRLRITGDTFSSLMVSWTAASDRITAADRLTYRLYYGTTNALDTVANIEANGTPAGAAEPDLTSAAITGLTPFTLYYFNVIVADAAGNKAVYDITPGQTAYRFPVGSYEDDDHYPHDLSAATWASGTSHYTLLQINKVKRYVVARNGSTNAWNPGLYSRFDWTTDGHGKLYYCQSADDKNSAAEAEAVTTADPADPASGGCGGFAWSGLTELDTIPGSFVDNWNGTHTINAGQWTNGLSRYHLVKLKGSASYLIALNGSDNAWNPGKYSRFDWTKAADGALYYCQSAYDKATAAEAEAVTAADPADPANGGCGGFAWSRLTAFSALIGNFVDNWQSTHTIDATRWVNGQSRYEITMIDTGAKYLLARNGSGNTYNPGQYSRFDWTISDGETYYCQIAYDKSTQAEAEAVTSADTGNLSAGCAGFGWSKLNAFAEIVGQFSDAYHYAHSVSATRWVSGPSGFSITKVDTTDRYAVAQNDVGNAHYPALFSRFDWTVKDGDLYYCQIAYDKVSVAAAEAETGADAKDLTCGCGGFGWSRLVR